MRLAFVVDLRAEDLAELDRLPLGVRQLERHVVLAGDGLDHADRHQRQRARQVLGEVDDLRALDAGGRLDLVARDHRAGRGQHHAHLDAEVLELLLDQARGHLQRVGRHGFLPRLRGIEQVDLRQLAVGQLAEQRLLALLGDAIALGHLGQRGLDLHRRRRRPALGARHDAQFLVGRIGLAALLDRCQFLALAHGLLAHRDVLGDLALFAARLEQRIEARADALGDLAPGEAEHERRADHAGGDGDQRRAGEAHPLHAQRARPGSRARRRRGPAGATSSR